MKIDVKTPIQARLTAGAVVYRKNQGSIEILCIRRVFPDGFEDITLPKGGVDDGESLQNCATREVLEETGYKVELEEFLDTFEFRLHHNEKNMYYFGRSYFFLAKLTDAEQKEVSHPEETEEIVWYPIDKAIEKMSFVDYKHMIELSKLLLGNKTKGLKVELDPSEFNYTIVWMLNDFHTGDQFALKKHRHITIKRRFKVLSSEQEVKEALTNLKKEVTKFKTGSVSSFEGNEELKFIEIEGSELKALHSQILNLISESTETRDPNLEGENYKPHLTLDYYGDGLNPDEQERLQDTEFEVDNIYLMKELNNRLDVWEVLKKL